MSVTVSSTNPPHPVDEAIRSRRVERAPAEHQSDCRKIVQAFADYEAGRDDAAKALLQEIGLSSPVAPWKLLLRGLIELAQGQPQKAQENFQRLKPGRLPYQLAQPLLQLNHSDTTQTAILRSLIDPVTGSAFQKPLHNLQLELSVADGNLRTAFSIAERLVPLLRQQHPPLVPLLAGILYAAIERQGIPEDLPRFRKIFGPFPDDPDFSRLQAIRREEVSSSMANQYWDRYEQWLGRTPPASWSKPLVNLVRAKVLVRTAENLQDDSRHPTTFRIEKSNPIFKRLSQAIKLAPEYPQPILDLLELACECPDSPEPVIQLAEAFLERVPNDQEVLWALTELLSLKSRQSLAIQYCRRLRELNPLDHAARGLAAELTLALVRKAALAKFPDQVTELLQQEADSLASYYPVVSTAFRIVFLLSQRQSDQAERALARLREQTPPIVANLALMIEAIHLKLKPALRKPFETGWQEAIGASSHTLDRLRDPIRAFQYYSQALPTYRGLKTHAKKINEAIEMALPLATSEQLSSFLKGLVAIGAYAQGIYVSKIMTPLSNGSVEACIAIAECVVNHPSAKQTDRDRAIRLLYWSRNRIDDPSMSQQLSRINELIDQLEPPPKISHIFDLF